MATLHSLRIFLEVYRTHSVTEASRNLFLTQPSVSRAIQDLETEYSVRLFERYHRRLIPTPVADRLYTHSTQVIESMDDMEEMLKQEKYQTKLRIGATITIGTMLMTSINQRFQKEHPDTRLEVTILNGSALQEELLDNTLDVALIEDSIHEIDLNAFPFYHDEMILLLPKNHPLAEKQQIELSDISSYPFLMREKGSAGREYVDELLKENNLQIEQLWQSVSTHALINAVEAGIGIAILPFSLCEETLKKKKVITRPIVHHKMKRTYYFVIHKQKYITKELVDLLDICKGLHDNESDRFSL